MFGRCKGMVDRAELEQDVEGGMRPCGLEKACQSSRPNGLNSPGIQEEVQM